MSTAHCSDEWKSVKSCASFHGFLNASPQGPYDPADNRHKLIRALSATAELKQEKSPQ